LTLLRPQKKKPGTCRARKGTLATEKKDKKSEWGKGNQKRRGVYPGSACTTSNGGMMGYQGGEKEKKKGAGATLSWEKKRENW